MTKAHFEVAPFNQDRVTRLFRLTFSPLFITLPISLAAFCLRLNRQRPMGHRCLSKAFYDLCFIHDLTGDEGFRMIPLLNPAQSFSFPFFTQSLPLSSGSKGSRAVTRCPVKGSNGSFSDPSLHKELQLVALLPPPPPPPPPAPRPVRAPLSGCRHHQRAHSKPSAQSETQTATL